MIDIDKIIKDNRLNFETVARTLYPGNSFAGLALKRVAAGTSELKATQLSRLALLVGCSVSELFTGGWKQRTKAGIMTLSTASYTATLDIAKGKTCLYHNDSLLHEELLTNKNMMLSEYIESLNKLVSKHQEK